MSSSSSTSSFSFVGTKKGTTYFSNFKDFKSIINPLISNSVQMRYRGHFTQNWTPHTITFPFLGYGLKRTQYTRGTIFCEDSSKLFSLSEGFIRIVLNFPYSITNGVYEPLTGIDQTYFIFGVNTGYYNIGTPGLSLFLTKNGMEYTIMSSATSYTITDNITNINSNTDTMIDFFWINNNRFEEYDNTNVVIRINGTAVIGCIMPINNDSLLDNNFYLLDTPLLANPLECTIKQLYIANEIPQEVREEINSSSSSSSSSIDSSSSSSTSYSTISDESSSSRSSLSTHSSSSSSSTFSSNSSSSSSKSNSSNSSSSSSTYWKSSSSSSSTINKSSSSSSSNSLSSNSSLSSKSNSSNSSSSMSSSSKSSSSSTNSSSSST